MKKLLFVLTLMLLIGACKKEDDPKPYYEFSVSNTTIDAARFAAQQNDPLNPNFIINSLGEMCYEDYDSNLSKEELAQLDELILDLATNPYVVITYGIHSNTPGYTPIYEIKYWYKDMENTIWMTQDITIPAELQDIWAWYQNVIHN